MLVADPHARKRARNNGTFRAGNGRTGIPTVPFFKENLIPMNLHTRASGGRSKGIMMSLKTARAGGTLEPPIRNHFFTHIVRTIQAESCRQRNEMQRYETPAFCGDGLTTSLRAPWPLWVDNAKIAVGNWNESLAQVSLN